ncbi:hypothetical protein D3C83_14790 [compost metagenome]
MIHPARKQEIGRAQHVDATRAEHVLRFDSLVAGGGREAGHDVRHAVHASEAAVACATQAVGSARPVKLRAAGERHAAGCDQRKRDGLTAFRDDPLAIVLDLDRVAWRPEAAGHGWSLASWPSGSKRNGGFG